MKYVLETLRLHLRGKIRLVIRLEANVARDASQLHSCGGGCAHRGERALVGRSGLVVRVGLFALGSDFQELLSDLLQGRSHLGLSCLTNVLRFHGYKRDLLRWELCHLRRRLLLGWLLLNGLVKLLLLLE